MNAGKSCPTTPDCPGKLATYSTETNLQVGVRIRYLRCNVCKKTPAHGGTDRIPLEFAPPRPRRICRSRRERNPEN